LGLRDESLEDAASLPGPDVATEITEDLGGLAQFELIQGMSGSQMM
jgi:hypothetical protein